MRTVFRCTLKILMILFLFVGCGYNLYYWERFSKKNVKPKETPIEYENVYYEESLCEDTLTNDTIEEIYTNY